MDTGLMGQLNAALSGIPPWGWMIVGAIAAALFLALILRAVLKLARRAIGIVLAIVFFGGFGGIGLSHLTGVWPF